MALQATEIDGITDRLNELAQIEKPSEFVIRSLMRDIEKVKSLDIACYYMLMGMTNSVAGNYAASKDFHEKSIRIRVDSVILVNYGLSMRRVGRNAESLVQLLRAFDLEPNSRSTFEELLISMVYAGDFSQYEVVKSRYCKANPGFEMERIEEAAKIESIRDDLQRVGVSELEYKRAVATVEGVLIEAGYVPRSNLIYAGSFDGVSHISTQYGLIVPSAKELVRVNDLIADAIVSAEDLPCWDKMVFSAIIEPQDASPVTHVA